jgi:hypothetical protein
MVPKEGIPPEYADAYTNYQVPSIIVYNQYMDKDPDKPLNIPTAIPRVPLPPEVVQTFISTDNMAQTILGDFAADLSRINSSQLSGIAIETSATLSNAASMPYVVNFLTSLNQIAKIILDLIPKTYLHPRVIPIVGTDKKKQYVKIGEGGVEMDYSPEELNIKVEAGVSFAVQKNKALNQIVALMQASPLFAQFMNTEGLEILLDNIEIRGVDQIKKLAGDFTKKMQAQQESQARAQSMSPAMAKIQVEAMKAKSQAESAARETQFEEHRILLEDHQRQTQYALEAARLDIGRQEQEIERARLLMQAHEKGQSIKIAKDAAESHKISKAIDHAMAASDMSHRHAHDVAVMHQKIEAKEIAKKLREAPEQEPGLVLKEHYQHEATESPQEELAEHREELPGRLDT